MSGPFGYERSSSVYKVVWKSDSDNQDKQLKERAKHLPKRATPAKHLAICLLETLLSPGLVGTYQGAKPADAVTPPQSADLVRRRAGPEQETLFADEFPTSQPQATSKAHKSC